MLGTVKQLSAPDPKLQLVNKLLRDVVRLDQLQRAQTIANPKKYNPFLKDSRDIQLTLDTLYALSSGNEAQLKGIDTMRRILRQRDEIFVSYMNLRNDYIKNDTLTSQIRLLSEFIGNPDMKTDSSVVTTEKKITTTTIEDVDTNATEERPSFWDRLVGRKKAPEVKQVKKLIQEELNIKIDTLAMAREDSVIQQISMAISNVENDRSLQRNKLIGRQQQLGRAGNMLITKLLSTLQDIETAELNRTEQNNTAATELVDAGLSRINFILIAFILCTALLAFLIFTDIAGSSKYKKELIAARDEAEQLGQVKQRFLANMSHEIRTPLQAIVGMAEQMKDDTRVKIEDVDIVYRSSQHLLQIVNEVLDYSRISSGKIMLENVPFNIKSLVDEVKDIINAQAVKKGLQLNYESNLSATAMYMGDPFRLRQILFNILGNAIKFTDNGSVTLHVKEHKNVVHSLISFTIADTGIGIPEADISLIFEDFEQANSSSTHTRQGSGLGLSIVRSLVETLKGNIKVSSQLNKGSVFTIQLPYEHADNTTKTSIHDATIDNYPGLIWIVDDDDFILRLCSAILTKHGVRHQCINKSTEAATMPIPADLSLVFLDIRMPDMDGFELCNVLKEKTKGTHMRFIALTAQALPNEREHILTSGFDSILAKPFMENDLLAAITGYNDTDNTNQSLLQFPKEIWQSFVNESRKDVDIIQVAIQHNDAPVISEHLHRLAGRMGQLNFTDFALNIRKAEIATRSSNQIPANIHELLSEINSRLNSIKPV